jgi:site-specific DNA-cytosine methylase
MSKEEKPKTNPNGANQFAKKNREGLSGARSGLYLTNSKGKTHQQDLLQTTEGKCRTIPAGTHGSTPHLLKTIMPNNQIRKLTPIECERLQSLLDNYTEGVSNTQRYKALGNGFNCKVIEHIIKNL